jgi:glutathione S-transferase
VIVVHHLENSRSQRVLWLLEELGVPYTIERYARDPKTFRAPEALRAVHPLGKSPVVTDGSQVLAESGAIVEYLIERYGEGRLIPPAGSAEHLRYRYWLHFAEGSAMPPLLLKLVFDTVARAPMPFFAKPIARGIADKVRATVVQPQIDQILDFVEAELGRSAWLAGSELTGADIQMSFPLEAAAARGGLDGSRPRIGDFLARAHARPAYGRALERGGPYTILR